MVVTRRPVPNTNIASNVGPQFDPTDADYEEVQRGGFAADYGDRTYAVVPRTGFERNSDAEIVVSAGSSGQTNDQVSAGGHTERFAYFASANGNRSPETRGTRAAAAVRARHR